MTTQDALITITAVVSAGTALISLFNAYQNKSIALIITELRLNLMREFNGRYERLEDAADIKKRLERLEEARMRHQNEP